MWLARKEGIERFFGTYQGFTPTDESNIGIGQLEVRIDAQEILMRTATGTSVKDETVPTSDLATMEEWELQIRCAPGYARKTQGYSHGRAAFLFLPRPKKNEYGLIIKGGEMAELMGHTALYSPSQVRKGHFDSWLKDVEAMYPGQLPLLNNDGKSRR